MKSDRNLQSSALHQFTIFEGQLGACIDKQPCQSCLWQPNPGPIWLHMLLSALLTIDWHGYPEQTPRPQRTRALHKHQIITWVRAIGLSCSGLKHLGHACYPEYSLTHLLTMLFQCSARQSSTWHAPSWMALLLFQQRNQVQSLRGVIACADISLDETSSQAWGKIWIWHGPQC